MFYIQGPVVFGNLYLYYAHFLNIRVRAALISLVYKKALVLSQKGKQMRSQGEIVNLMSVDAQKIGEVVQWYFKIILFNMKGYILHLQVYIKYLSQLDYYYILLVGLL